MDCSRLLRAVCALSLVLGAAAPAAGQEPPDSTEAVDASDDPRPRPCTDAEFRAFDYWIGEWIVRNADGEQVGTSRITRVSDGCGILEQWSGATSGTSLNYFDPASNAWYQRWVGGGGLLLDLEGGLEDGVMTLRGERITPEGAVMDRIRWIPLDDGRVEQRWDMSTDGGETWHTTFRGFYEPRDSAGS